MFFNQIRKTHFIGIDHSQLFGNEFELIQQLKNIVPFNLNSLLIDPSLDRFRHLNNNRIQLILSRSNEIYNLIHQISPVFTTLRRDHLRFVCALYQVPVNLLTTVMGIEEVEQLRRSRLTVNVGPQDSSDYLIAMDLITQYRLVVGDDICLSFYDTNQLLSHYGKDVQVVLVTRTHPDQMVNRLINIQLTRMIEIRKYNDGNIYHVNLDEREFYRAHPYYSKMILEKDRLSQYYPSLVLQDWVTDHKPKQPIDSYQSRFINTIGVTYYLLSNDQTDRDSINQLLYNLRINISSINQLGFIDEAINSASLTNFTMSIPIHPGASDFYFSSGLSTHLSNPNCVFINGRCDHQQLRDHHLEHKFGPTFDAMYNT